MACRRGEARQILKGVRYLRTQVFQPFFQDGVVFRIGSPVLRHLVAYFSGCVRHAVHDLDHIGHIVFKLCSFLACRHRGDHAGVQIVGAVLRHRKALAGHPVFRLTFIQGVQVGNAVQVDFPVLLPLIAVRLPQLHHMVLRLVVRIHVSAHHARYPPKSAARHQLEKFDRQSGRLRCHSSGKCCGGLTQHRGGNFHAEKL